MGDPELEAWCDNEDFSQMFSTYKNCIKSPDDAKYVAYTAEEWKDLMGKYVALALNVVIKIDKSLQ